VVITRPARRLALIALVTAAVSAACASDPVPTGTTRAESSTAVLPASFCDPMRALSVDAWNDTGARPTVAADLARARAKAPPGLQAALDDLIQLEQSGAGVATTGGTTTGTGRARWFEAMRTLADVAQRECGIDIAAGAGGGAPPTGATTPSTPPGPRTTGNPLGTLSFDDIVELVRAGRPSAPWVDRPVTGTVAVGTSVQVEVAGVDGPSTALQICADVLAVLPPRTEPPSITVRDGTGFVVVTGDAQGCQEHAHP